LRPRRPRKKSRNRKRRKNRRNSNKRTSLRRRMPFGQWLGTRDQPQVRKMRTQRRKRLSILLTTHHTN